MKEQKSKITKQGGNSIENNPILFFSFRFPDFH